MKRFTWIIISLLALISCNKSDWHDNYEELKLQYNGKYELLSSYSDDAVDLNMDGIYSTDLPVENPEIQRARLEIKIIAEDRMTEPGKHLFDEMWPVAHISLPRGEVFDSTRYHESYSIMYAMKIMPCWCEFEDNNSIIVLGEPTIDESSALISFESIDMDENDIITFVTLRKLYTIDGWVETRITSRYKRYTDRT
ncbi:hypothetical protein [Draconibacterium mangrovi]|uniref:hypothetical protein n=1 Tax=Draconibacterium mangrovi TaxID=2697469 RepID=UPI0013D635CF|nr:hypothetical protein [Draconibacterium mangrovi]